MYLNIENELAIWFLNRSNIQQTNKKKTRKKNKFKRLSTLWIRERWKISFRQILFISINFVLSVSSDSILTMYITHSTHPCIPKIIYFFSATPQHFSSFGAFFSLSFNAIVLLLRWYTTFNIQCTHNVHISVERIAPGRRLCICVRKNLSMMPFVRGLFLHLTFNSAKCLPFSWT